MTTTKKKQQYKKGIVVSIAPIGLKKAWAHGGSTKEMPPKTRATITKIVRKSSDGELTKIYVTAQNDKEEIEWVVTPEEITSYEPPVLPELTAEEIAIYACIRTATRAVNAAEISEASVIFEGKTVEKDALTKILAALHKKKLVAVLDRDKEEDAVFKRYFTRSIYRDLADDLLVEKKVVTKAALGLADKERSLNADTED